MKNKEIKIRKINNKIFNNVNFGRRLGEETKKSYLRDLKLFIAFIKDNRLKINKEGIISYFEYARDIKNYVDATLNRKRFAILKYFNLEYFEKTLDRIIINVGTISYCFKLY